MAGPPSLKDIYLPITIGTLLSTLLYGATLVQFFIYYQTSKRDALWIRSLILYLFVAATVNTVFNFMLVIDPLLLQAGEARPLITSPRFLSADSLVTVAISTPIQLFMAWRILVLSGSKILLALITVISLVAFGGGTWTCISVILSPNFQSFDSFKAAPTTWLIATAVVDVIITICLSLSLSKKKSGFHKEMDSYITSVVLMTIQTGAITAVAATADAIVFLSLPHSTIFFAWDLCLAKLYINSILSSLNARNSLRQPVGQAGNALFDTSSQGSKGTSRLSGRVPQNAVMLSEFPPPRQPHLYPKEFSDGRSNIDFDVEGHPTSYGGLRVTKEVTVSMES